MEADELAAAHKRIAQLEAGLVLTRDACELFDEQAVVPPKGRRAITAAIPPATSRPVPDREARRLIVADTNTEIHQ